MLSCTLVFSGSVEQVIPSFLHSLCRDLNTSPRASLSLCLSYFFRATHLEVFPPRTVPDGGTDPLDRQQI